MELPSKIVEADNNGKTSPYKSFRPRDVVKEQSVELEKNSGIQTSIQPQDIKQYLLEVVQEVDKHKSTEKASNRPQLSSPDIAIIIYTRFIEIITDS
jgi:hypothetical protein